jgi:hypothetical protein
MQNLKQNKSKNPFREDPTRTLTLRNRAVREINRRFGKIKQLINESLVKNNALQINARALTESDFIFMRTPEKLERFDVWLDSGISELILSGSTTVNSPDVNWLLVYLQESYIRGVKGSNAAFARTYGRNEVPERVIPITTPIHVESMQMLFTRDFNQLKGITQAMSQQMNYILSKRVLEGKGIRKIAKELNDRVDKIGISRSRLLARTEIINAKNLASIVEADEISGFLGEPVVFQWFAGSDARVRDEHRRRDNKYYTKEKVMGLIGEPNCRCAVEMVSISLLPDDAKVIE